MSKALEDIAAERRRQVDVEGWTEYHDDGQRYTSHTQALGVVSGGEP